MASTAQTLPASNTPWVLWKKNSYAYFPKVQQFAREKAAELQSFPAGGRGRGLSASVAVRVRHFHSRSINFISSIYKSNIAPASTTPHARDEDEEFWQALYFMFASLKFCLFPLPFYKYSPLILCSLLFLHKACQKYWELRIITDFRAITQ